MTYPLCDITHRLTTCVTSLMDLRFVVAAVGVKKDVFMYRRVRHDSSHT